ncbi:MAG: amidohydrolase [Acidobacteria bacterium]|nr:MAG: amidohydrolase [Acidobacteriota bacterium]PYU42714.1 MAG: amidohydrolase [Acidobacteriota bacterium]PYU76461.1 MAG: amidohydrolase [Acidobacteriota bacterium]
MGMSFFAGRLPIRSSPVAPEGAGKPLQLADFQPRSMLHVPETKVLRSRHPVIDIHTHLSFTAKSANGVGLGEAMEYPAPVEELLPLMDRKNIRVMVNLTGGVGKGLEQTIRKFQQPYPERFVTFTEPWWERSNQLGYSKFQADEIVRAQQAGARGLKILKTLGLYLREEISKGPLVRIDDPRFDAMWETCGSLGMPVAIHVSDPEAFFLPIDRFNERFEELNKHPDWSFHGGDFPSNAELLEARNRVLARHPKTQFIVLHVGNDAENLPYVGECLDRFPNMHVELGARIGELGRQPRMAKKLFEKYQDRILFGTDAVPHGSDTPQQICNDELYEIYYRFLETEDEYFDYAPAPVPPQGRWRIYGLGLPDGILKKVYFENAARLLRFKT